MNEHTNLLRNNYRQHIFFLKTCIERNSLLILEHKNLLVSQIVIGQQSD
jgi:hypothetical protein